MLRVLLLLLLLQLLKTKLSNFILHAKVVIFSDIQSKNCWLYFLVLKAVFILHFIISHPIFLPSHFLLYFLQIILQKTPKKFKNLEKKLKKKEKNSKNSKKCFYFSLFQFHISCLVFKIVLNCVEADFFNECV